MLAFAPLGGCNSDDTEAVSATEGIEPQPACAGGDGILIGQMYECSGTRKARIDLEICTGAGCDVTPKNWQPIQNPLMGGPPLVPDDQLNIEQAFFSKDGNPPPTGACCDPNNPEFVPGDPGVEPPEDAAGSVRLTAYNDCAARSCLEVHDQIVEIQAEIQKALDAIPVIPFPEKGWAENAVIRNAHQRAIDSLAHYAKHLELPSAFQLCAADLANPEGNSAHTYIFPDPPGDAGPGSLRNLIISAFDCVDLSCAVADGDSTTGGGDPTTGGSNDFCTQNPNWFPGNAAPSLTGTGVPQPGAVIFTLDNADTEQPFTGIVVAYERLANCPANEACPFALTDLRFTTGDVAVGPFTFLNPSVSLRGIAFGTQVGDTITVPDGALALRVESKIEIAKKPFLETGAMTVANKGPATMVLSNGVLELQDAHFDLFNGALARLVIAATTCDEK